MFDKKGYPYFPFKCITFFSEHSMDPSLFTDRISHRYKKLEFYCMD